MSDRIKVLARVRTFTPREVENNDENVIYCGGQHHLRLQSKDSCIGSKDFHFDRVFDSSTSQDDLFDEISPLLESSLHGHNVSCYSYGQTGTGSHIQVVLQNILFLHLYYFALSSPNLCRQNIYDVWRLT